MTGRRRVVLIGSLVLAGILYAIALSAIDEVNADARVLVALASLVFPMCAVGAALALRVGKDRLAGLLLVLSGFTPTYFAYPFSVLAMLVGLSLVVAPGWVGRLERQPRLDPVPR